MIALGSFSFSFPLQNWPNMSGLHWLLDQPVPACRSDMSQIASLNAPFLQLLTSSDLIITKPGYGTYCEIACLAKYKKIRVMSMVHPDWPEKIYLNRFLAARVPFIEIDETQLIAGALTCAIKKVDEMDYPQVHECEDGATQLVEQLMSVQ